MPLDKTLWTTIQDLVDSGQDVSDALDLAFGNIDTAIDQIDTNTAQLTTNTADIATIKQKLNIRTDNQTTDVNTIVAAGIYEITTGANKPATETSGVLTVTDYDTLTKKEQKFYGASGKKYTRTSALGDGTDWTAWAEDLLSARVTANEDYIANPKALLDFEPQNTPPAYLEGRAYYDNVLKTFSLMGPFSDVIVEVGHGMHTHVINNSGALIEKGSACRHDGVAGGIVQIQKAQADTFVNAEIFGVAQHDIPNGSEGAIVTFGEIRDLDTSSVAVGVPLYLSDTVAGGWQETPPDIVSQVGGAVTQDALTGRLFVSIVSNKNIPTVFAGMQGQTVGNDTYNVTTTVQDINDYLTLTNVVMSGDLPTGVITLSNDGNYRLHFSAGISFPTSTSTRTVYLELYDITNTNILYTYAKNIPRDATEDGFSFSFPFSGLANNQYKIRIRSSVAIDVTFDNVSYDLTSISIV